MMKKMKKLSVLVLALMICLMNMITVFAANDNAAGHTYTLYQIFTGTYSNGILSDVKWGQNSNPVAGEAVGKSVNEDVLKELSEISPTASNEDKMNVIQNYITLPQVNETGELIAQPNGAPVDTSTTGEFTVAKAGYYLVVDTITSGNGTAYDAVNYYFVTAAGDNSTIKVTPKMGKPEVDKEVFESNASASDNVASSDKNNDTAETNTSGWAETADHAIGQVFPFRLTAALPGEGLAEYKHYYLQFNDTLSAGVAYKGNLRVYVNGTKIASGYDVTVPETEEGGTLTVVINDLVGLNGITAGAGLHNAKVTVVYDAVLTENAQVQSAGESDPQTTTNKNEVDLNYSNKWDYDGRGNPVSTGKTPKDTVWVFTYEMPNEKIDGASETEDGLAGAKFKLFNSDESKEAVFENGVFTGWSDLGKGTEITTELDASKKAYFNLKGLDAGNYILKETEAPDGYNTCEPITVTISANDSEDSEGTGYTTVTMTQDTKTVTSNKIVNNKGTTLPSTGGIGTTIFYVTGSILALGAAVLLIVKKRMSMQL